MPKDKITSESRMRENRTFGLMRGREVYRPTLPTLLKLVFIRVNSWFKNLFSLPFKDPVSPFRSAFEARIHPSDLFLDKKTFSSRLKQCDLKRE